jgi:hypothetical protein
MPTGAGAMFFETKSNLASNIHTTMDKRINDLKTNTEMNTNSGTNPAPTPMASAARRSATSLKLGAAILSLTALYLSYRAANEAVALYGELEAVQDTLAAAQFGKVQIADGTGISETKKSVAGL